MANNELHDVFISYRRYEDNEKTNPKGLLLAERIYNYLTEKGLKVFWDKPEMKPGDFAEQLDWQLEHCPNYIFIATENAMRFREGQEDFVEHELKTALALYDKAPEDRIILPIFPYSTIEEKQSAAAKGPYDPAVERVQWLHGVELSAVKPSNDELREILRHVTRITRSNMWNAGYCWLQQAKKERFAGITINDSLFSLAGKHEEVRFPINVRRKGEEERPLMDAIRDAKTHLYLIGAGGIGKTTALLRIMEEAYDEENGKQEFSRTSAQVPLFIELSRAPDVIPDDRGSEWQVYSSGKSTFIHREIYRQIRRDLRLRQIHEGVLEQIDDIYKADYEVAVRPITNLLGDSKPEPEYLLLMDGLNEVSRREIKKYNEHGELDFNRSVISMVLDEIRQIMKYKNVRVILTSRSKEAVSFTENIELLDLSGIKPETIKQYLKDMKAPEARIKAASFNKKLQDILRTPLFLIMYAKLNGEEELLTAGEIMHLFYHGNSPTQYTQTARAEEVQRNVKESSEDREPASRVTPEMISFILGFILPELAWRMVKAQEFRIRRDTLGKDGEGLDEIIEQVLTDNGETSTCGRYTSYVFSKYVSENCSDLAEFASSLMEHMGGMKKAINAILHCAVYTLGILYRTDNDYGFTHHQLRDYFSAVYHINKLKLAVYLQGRKKSDLARACLDEWNEHPLPAMTRQFIGEALGEAHNAPACDEFGNWQYAVPTEQCERSLIKQAFALYKDRFDNHDCYGIWNLIEILKACRKDLSGEDFSSLDLALCEVNGYSLGKKTLSAVFKGTRVNDQFFIPRGHSHAVKAVAYSPDAHWIVTGSADGSVKFWNVQTFQVSQTLSAHVSSILDIKYSPDGSKFITVSDDKTTKMWDSQTLQLVGSLSSGCDRIHSVAFSPDSRNLLTASREITIWDVDTLHEVGTIDCYAMSAAYSPDGQRIVTASGCGIVWDVKTLTKVNELNDHTDVHSVIYSNDGCRIITTTYNGVVKIWDAETFEEIGTIFGCSNADDINAYTAISPYGDRIITSSINEAPHIWDVRTCQNVHILYGHFGVVNYVVYSPDGREFVTASSDNTAKVWDAETFQELGTLAGSNSIVEWALFSPNGQDLVTTGRDGFAKKWCLDTNRLIGTMRVSRVLANCAVYSPNGLRIATASMNGNVWDAETLVELGSLCGHSLPIKSIEYSPDGSRIVTASWDTTTKVWNAETLELIGTLKGHMQSVFSAVFSPDGLKILTASQDGTARIWDAKALSEIGIIRETYHALGLNPFLLYAVYNTSGNTILTAGSTIKLYDAETLELIHELDDYPGFVLCASYAPDGRKIVSTNARFVKVWDAETNKQIGMLRGHYDAVVSASFSPDGRHIVTASVDGTSKIWDAETFECLHTFRNIPGLEVMGVDLRDLHPDSQLSDEVKELLYEYGAIVDERE